MKERHPKGKRWARGTRRGLLRNPPMHATARVHPRRRYGDHRKPWKRTRPTVAIRFL